MCPSRRQGESCGKHYATLLAHTLTHLRFLFPFPFHTGDLEQAPSLDSFVTPTTNSM